MDNLPQIIVNEKTLRRLKSGYPWVMRPDMSQPNLKDFEAGSLVDFVGAKGLFAARGYIHPKTVLAGRALTRYEHENIDDAFWDKRVRAAFEKREALYKEPFYRLIHAESDGFPGLIVDRYGDYLAVQVNTVGMHKLYPQIEKILVAVLKPKAIIVRSDEGIDDPEKFSGAKIGVSYGTLDTKILPIEENGITFYADIVEGQKTGWFYDQRDNRRDVAALARGKTMLDMFCYNGGFGVTAAVGGASSVLFVDSSEDAIERARGNAARNSVEAKCKFINGKAFNVLEQLAKEERTFDVVCVDPPAFIKSRRDAGSGLHGYQKLAKLSAPLVAEKGHMFFASCSHHASLKDLIRNVGDGIKKAGRKAELIKTSGAAPDHPVHPLLPETGYLKALTFKFLD